ncbi:MFS multidrug transporter [Histoplasma capsulatum]|uniref:MFS multidrug transporter n=1 Tax=Ajellomyces capsulatus TaxID=5037 RepID=A0A8A1M9K9_AJECA|nr:MFS multidrug transporter [Histoplasma capsulatum]
MEAHVPRLAHKRIKQLTRTSLSETNVKYLLSGCVCSLLRGVRYLVTFTAFASSVVTTVRGISICASSYGISTVGSSTNLGSHDPPEHLHHDTKHQENFSGLVAQKHAAEEREEERREEPKPEDRSFAYRKPGAGNLLKEFLGNHLCVTSAEESGDIEGGRHGIMRLLQRRKEDVGDAITIV